MIPCWRVGGRPDEYELGQDMCCVGGQNTHMHIPVREKLPVTNI